MLHIVCNIGNENEKSTSTFMGILVLLATATIAATYNVQPVNAKSTGDSNFGQNQASPQAHGTQNYGEPPTLCKDVQSIDSGCLRD